MRILFLAKLGSEFTIWHGSCQRPVLKRGCPDIAGVVTGVGVGESGKSTVQQSRASVPRRMDKTRLRIQDTPLGMCLFPWYSVRFPEIWALDIMTLEGLGATDIWTRNDIWRPTALETKEHLCLCQHILRCTLCSQRSINSCDCCCRARTVPWGEGRQGLNVFMGFFNKIKLSSPVL